jgi:hypothetical protein
VVDGSESLVETAGESIPTEAFRCDTNTFVLLMYGRLTPDAAIASGLLEPGKNG